MCCNEGSRFPRFPQINPGDVLPVEVARFFNESRDTDGDDPRSESEDAPGEHAHSESNVELGNSWHPLFRPLELKYEALKRIASVSPPGRHGNCTMCISLSEEGFHEREMLHFQDGWRCIARFVTRKKTLEQLESELATMQYVRKHTSIPVPEVYLTNFDPTNSVGAPFMLMEHLPGMRLGDIWDDLTLEHKKAAIAQIANVIAELSGLKFSTIGNLKKDGSMGPLLLQGYEKHSEDSFARELTTAIGSEYTTAEKYMLSFVPDPREHPEKINRINDVFREALLTTLEDNAEHPALSAPYRLLHGCLYGQNIRFTHADESQPPKLSGIFEWDSSYIATLYELLEYPIWIQDVDWKPRLFAENKILRKNFVRSLKAKFPKGSAERRAVKETFRMKTWVLQNFDSMWCCDEGSVERCAYNARKLLRGNAKPYEDVEEWEPDTDSESEDDTN